jgi:hypothetical protein
VHGLIVAGTVRATLRAGLLAAVLRLRARLLADDGKQLGVRALRSELNVGRRLETNLLTERREEVVLLVRETGGLIDPDRVDLHDDNAEDRVLPLPARAGSAANHLGSNVGRIRADSVRRHGGALQRAELGALHGGEVDLHLHLGGKVADDSRRRAGRVAASAVSSEVKVVGADAKVGLHLALVGLDVAADLAEGSRGKNELFMSQANEGGLKIRRNQTNLRLVGGNDAALVDNSLVLLDIAPVVRKDGLRGGDCQHGAKQNRN